jgi:hypothetical protein
MTGLLILLAMPPEITAQYYGRLQAAFPDLDINLLDHPSKVEPLIGSTDTLVTFGPMLTAEVLRKPQT